MIEVGQIINGWEVCSFSDNVVYRLAKDDNRLIVTRERGDDWGIRVSTPKTTVEPFLPIIDTDVLTVLEQATFWANGVIKQ